MKKTVDNLKGGDLRSIGEANRFVREVNNQADFDLLFKGLFHADREVVMRTADALEKITIPKPEYLKKHKKDILSLCEQAKHIELKWHLALLVSRLKLTQSERDTTWKLLKKWAEDKNESKLVRVNSIQGLYNLSQRHREFESDFSRLIGDVLRERIPSLSARIRKIRL